MKSKQQLPAMLERIQRCRFCRKELADIPALSFLENPYCSECRSTRVANAVEGIELISWKVSGDYFEPIDLSQQKRQ
jgi:hypothetical protein